MGDAARELADRLHFLGLAQLLLQRAPLRHVLRDSLEAFDRAAGAAHCAAGEPHQDLSTVPALPRDLHSFDHVRGLEAPEDALALVRIGVDVGREVHPQQMRFGLVAEHPHQRGVHVEEPSLDRRPVDGVGGMMHQGAVALLRLTQRGLRPAPLGDVGPDADHARHRSIHVAHRRIPRFEHDAEHLDGG